MGLPLYILSIFLRAIIVTAAMIYNIIKLFHQSHFDNAFKYVDRSFFEMAKAVDKYGNVVCAAMFNDLLITKESKHLFGADGEYISGVLGWNYLDGTLTKTGLFINNALNYFWRDHTIRAAKGIKEKPATSDFVLLLIKIKNFITFKNFKMKISNEAKAGLSLGIPFFAAGSSFMSIHSAWADEHQKNGLMLASGIFFSVLFVGILVVVAYKWAKRTGRI